MIPIYCFIGVAGLEKKKSALFPQYEITSGGIKKLGAVSLLDLEGTEWCQGLWRVGIGVTALSWLSGHCGVSGKLQDEGGKKRFFHHCHKAALPEFRIELGPAPGEDRPPAPGLC